MIITYPDGTLFIDRTAECALYAKLDNRFGAGPGDQVYHLDGFTVEVIKGNNALPETLRVTDHSTGQVYALTIPEDATGEVCVAWSGMS